MVAHIGYVLPWYFGMGDNKCPAEFVGSFADNHCIIDYAAELNLVGDEGVVCHAFCTRQNGVYSIDDVD